MSGKANPIDKALFKAIVILLFGTFTVSRIKLVLFSSPTPPWYDVVVFFDMPLLIIVFSLFILAMLRLGREIEVKNFWFFIILPVFLLWLGLSGVLMTEKPLFFAVGYSQWMLAYLVFILVPPLLRPFDLIDYALDVFLMWAIFAAGIHLAVIAAFPEKILDGVLTVFGGNRAHVGLFFLIALAVSVYAWSERRRHLHLIAMVASVLCILTSGSRASQMAAVLFLVMHILSSRSWKIMLVGLPAIGSMIALFKLILTQRASDSFAVSQGVSIDASAGLRLLIWLKSWEIITQNSSHFFFGIGYGNFRFLFGKLVTSPFYASAAHNMYLHYWVETGLVGLLLLLAVCATILVFCWRFRKQDASLKYMSFLTLGFLFTGFTQETLQPNTFNGNVITLYFLILGLVMYKARNTGAAPSPAGKAA